jgi:signal peptidase I
MPVCARATLYLCDGATALRLYCVCSWWACMEAKAETDTERPSWLRTILIGRRPERTLVRIVVLVVTCLVVFRFVFLPIRVEGASMAPTYKDRRVNFVNRLAYLFHEPQRGDVVAIKLSGISVMYMKRIIGLPGDTVAFHDGRAYINGQLLAEPYVKFPSSWEQEAKRLGPMEYYFVGDNRSMPQADHTQGKADRERIVGKVLL